jgi:hypothetical protein
VMGLRSSARTPMEHVRCQPRGVGGTAILG